MKIMIVIILIVKFCLNVCIEIHHKKDFTFITGKGCGIQTPIKYLSEIPQNIEDHECSIIKPDLDGDAMKIGNVRVIRLILSPE